MKNAIPLLLRIISATLGAYLVSVLFSLAYVPLAVVLFSSLISDAVYGATMWSYVVFFLCFIASFAISTVKRLYLLLAALSGVLAGIFYWGNTLVMSGGQG